METPVASTELLQRLWQIAPAFVEGVPHAQRMGMRFVSVDFDSAALSLPYNPDFIGDPQTGVLHGGAITALLDQTCGLAVVAAALRYSSSENLRAVATLDMRIDYLRPAKINETVLAKANCYKVTRHIAFVRAIAHDGDEADPVATCQATFMIKARHHES